MQYTAATNIIISIYQHSGCLECCRLSLLCGTAVDRYEQKLCNKYIIFKVFMAFHYLATTSDTSRKHKLTVPGYITSNLSITV